jgi:hypothetical protein
MGKPQTGLAGFKYRRRSKAKVEWPLGTDKRKERILF